MDDWVVGLLVAAIGALATILAAYLAAAKDRRDVRANIERDIEILKSLSDDSPARQVLQRYVDERAQRLVAEQALAVFSRVELFHNTIAIAFVGAFVVGTLLDRPWEITGLAAGAYLYVIIGSWGNTKKREKITSDAVASHRRSGAQAPSSQ